MRYAPLILNLYEHIDAHGDVLRGLQVVETACGITSTLLGDKIEVSKDMDTETRRLPLGVCARSELRLRSLLSLTNKQYRTLQLPCVSNQNSLIL